VAFVAVLVTVGRGPAVPQPVAFNHLKHTSDLGLACDFCHKYVRTGAHAGLPDAGTCSMCHRAPQGDSAEAARVTELLEAGDGNCHGPIAKTERPPERPLVRVSMDSCMDCHRERGQSLDCNACHR
jgi:hypothetical protein